MPLCPHCGQQLDIDTDPGGGEDQSYIEDCDVCCRPVRVHVTYNEIDNEYRVEVSADV